MGGFNDFMGKGDSPRPYSISKTEFDKRWEMAFKKGADMKIELKRRFLWGKWYWRIKASNGRIIAHSETYSSKFKAEQTIASLIRWAKKQ